MYKPYDTPSNIYKEMISQLFDNPDAARGIVIPMQSWLNEQGVPLYGGAGSVDSAEKANLYFSGNTEDKKHTYQFRLYPYQFRLHFQICPIIGQGADLSRVYEEDVPVQSLTDVVKAIVNYDIQKAIRKIP